MSLSRDTTTVHDISTDAGFRAWAQSIHDRLSAVGLVQTADTGQINLTTATTPASNATSGGYEIWRFNDSQQGADPLYFRIDYARGSAATKPAFWLVVGTGSNGSGTISGTTIDQFNNGTFSTPATAPSGAGTIHCAHSSGSLVLICHCNNGNATSSQYAYGICLERIRNPDGTYKGSTAVCLAYSMNGATILGWRHISKDTNGRAAAVTDTTDGVGFEIPIGTSTADGSDHWAASFIPATRRPEHPLIGILGLKTGEVADGDTGTISIGGVSRSYRQMNWNNSGGTAGGAPNFGCTVLNE